MHFKATFEAIFDLQHDWYLLNWNNSHMDLDHFKRYIVASEDALRLCGCEVDTLPHLCWPGGILGPGKEDGTESTGGPSTVTILHHPKCAAAKGDKNLNAAIQQATKRINDCAKGPNFSDFSYQMVYVLPPQLLETIREQGQKLLTEMGGLLYIPAEMQEVEDIDELEQREEEISDQDFEVLSQELLEEEAGSPPSQQTLTQMLGKPTVPEFNRELFPHQEAGKICCITPALT